MKRLLLLVGALVLGAGAAVAQNVPRPDCVIDVTLTAATQSAGGQGTCGNNINGVVEWRLIYKSTGFTVLSLIVQSAPPDVNGVCTAAVWVAFAGTVVGANPNTAITQNTATFTGFYSCMRVFLTSVTGTGTITGQLYGCREPGCSISGATINAVIPTPVPVDGPTAAGLAPTTPPVLVAGQDGTPGVIRTLKTDSVGELIPSNTSNADADGVSNTQATPTGAAAGVLYPRVFGRVFNGTTWDRMPGNTSGVAPTNASTADADGVSNTEATQTAVGGGVLYPRVFGRVFNGTTWDRMPGNTSGVAPTNASTADADGVSNTEATQTAVGGGVLYPRVFGRVFNGTTWDRQRGNTSGASPANASSADADAVSNTELAPTDAAGAVLYPRIFPRVYNGTTWDRQRGNTSGTAPTNASSAGADGVNNTGLAPTDSASAIIYPRVEPMAFNGTTWDRQFWCTNQAAISLTSGTDVIIITGVSSTNARICHISFSGATTATVTIRQGTGSTCGTNTATLAGDYASITSLALDLQPTAALRTTVAARDVCLHFSTSVTVGGVVVYAQF